MGVTIQQLPGIPMLKISGSVGAFLELGERSGTPYRVMVSDGTLLSGVVGEYLEIELVGTGKVSIDANVVTVLGPVKWVGVADPDRTTTRLETLEFREESFGREPPSGDPEI